MHAFFWALISARRMSACQQVALDVDVLEGTHRSLRFLIPCNLQ